jgi:hypothetical protein
MKLRTDDDIYRARLLYLGPPGYTLPFQLPYAQWALFAILAAVFVFVGWLVTGTLLSAGFTLAAAIFLTAYIWHHVDPDRPAKKVIQVALTDWKAVKAPAEQLPRMTTSHIKWRSTITEPNRPEITNQKTEVQR